MTPFHKVLASGILLALFICAPAQAADKTAPQAFTRPVNNQTLSAFIQEASLPVSSDETSGEISFYYLTETASGKPYTLEFRKKKIVPAFISFESAEKLSKLANASGPQNTTVTQNNLSEFRIFLKERQAEGLSVRMFPSGSQALYMKVRPMTWGVGSSYLFGTVLVLFILWAITRGTKHK